MTQFEIFSVIISIVGLVILIIGFWIKNKTDVAQIQAQLIGLQNELKEHKQEDALRYEQMRTENRQDHGKLFDKIENIFKELRKWYSMHS